MPISNFIIIGQTSGDDALETLPGGGAVPASVPELLLAFRRAQLSSFDDLSEHLRLLLAQLRLTSSFFAPGPQPVAHGPGGYDRWMVHREVPLPDSLLGLVLAAESHGLHARLPGSRPFFKKETQNKIGLR